MDLFYELFYHITFAWYGRARLTNERRIWNVQVSSLNDQMNSKLQCPKPKRGT